MAAELHNSVDLLCDTKAAELNPVWCMHQESHTFSKDSDEPCWKYEGLIQSKILLRLLNALEDSTNPWQTQIDARFTKANSKDELRRGHMKHHVS